jgi:hypothetical protein
MVEETPDIYEPTEEELEQDELDGVEDGAVEDEDPSNETVEVGGEG